MSCENSRILVESLIFASRCGSVTSILYNRITIILVGTAVVRCWGVVLCCIVDVQAFCPFSLGVCAYVAACLPSVTICFGASVVELAYIRT